MALTLKPIGVSGKSRVPLENVDADIATAVEEAYAWCQANPGRLETEALTDRDAAEGFLKQARSYAYQRPEGRVIVTGNPASADGGKAVVRFRVDAYTAPAAEATASS